MPRKQITNRLGNEVRASRTITDELGCREWFGRNFALADFHANVLPIAKSLDNELSRYSSLKVAGKAAGMAFSHSKMKHLSAWKNTIRDAKFTGMPQSCDGRCGDAKRFLEVVGADCNPECDFSIELENRLLSDVFANRLAHGEVSCIDAPGREAWEIGNRSRV